MYNSKTGTLQSVTDTKGITTNYTYDPNTDQVLSVAKNNQSVEYTYDNYYRLTEISHEGTEYTFTYDAFGNPIDTKVGSRTLSTNHYDSNNGSLLSMTYGNGSTVAYTYDVFGNKKEISYNGTKVVENFTDSAGNINRTHDLLTNLEHRVTYDTTGRLVSKEVLDLTASGDRWLRSLEYDYDLNNNVTYIAYADKQGSNVTQYAYGDDNLLEKTTLDNGKEVTYNYDTFGRLTNKELVLDATNDKKLTSSYTYADSLRDSVEGKTYTTTKLYTETIGDTTYKYTYDTYGNIAKIQRVNADNSEKTLYTYIYDEYNQLSSVNDQVEKTYTIYSYDESGNITRKIVQNLHPSYGYPIGDQCDITYTYGDSEWKDLLTTYNGQTLTYDAIGNPLTYRDGITFTWQNGRQLASYSDATQNITYTYDASGLRTGKVVTNSSNATIQYTYVYENNLLQKMTRGSRTFEFSYDAYGNPVSIKYRSSASATPIYYYYGLNSRGDVVALYSSNGALSVLYTYDAYGKLLKVTDSYGAEIISETSIAQLNPFRYRSYIYDNESGLYFINGNYYDPELCRFVCSNLSFSNLNFYSYSDNNPTSFSYVNTNPKSSVSMVASNNGLISEIKNKVSQLPSMSSVGSASYYLYEPACTPQDYLNAAFRNCYAYAIDYHMVVNPGDISGVKPIDRSSLAEQWHSIQMDLRSLGYTVRLLSGANSLLYENEYMVAFRLSLESALYDPSSDIMYYNFHFMVKTKTGQWADKMGGAESHLYEIGESPDNINWHIGKDKYLYNIVYFAVGK